MEQYKGLSFPLENNAQLPQDVREAIQFSLENGPCRLAQIWPTDRNQLKTESEKY